jgi:opacity protein-like surface antigen
MKKLNVSAATLSLLAICLIIPNVAAAQWSIGASYQVRNDNPKKGFGVQIQRHILKKLPLVDIGFRARFSYFNENNNISKNGITLGKITYYDFGVDAVGGVGLGIIEPYVGIGIGSNKYKFKKIENGAKISKSKFYWNTFVGAELTLIPVLHPFIEYRFMPTDSPTFKNINFDSNGRLVIGLLLAF